MQILEQLGVALGLASLAGVNLYLTVLITGLAIRFDWVHLADRYHSLDALGHPAVIGVAAVLFAMQFFADKIPWVDSLWDSVHTIIRPVGATMIALQALGQMPAYMQVVAALCAGGAALTTHGAKAGTRLLINHSPEPVSNIAMSLAEDAGVMGGMALIIIQPAIALAVFGGLLVILWLIFPRMWRLIRSTWWLAWHKLKMPGKRYPLGTPEELPRELNEELRLLLQTKAAVTDLEVKWTVNCLSGKCKGVRGLSANLRGVLIGTSNPDRIHFATNKGLRDRLFHVPLQGVTVEVESKFLSENVLITARGLKAVFRFPRGASALAETIALRLKESLETAHLNVQTLGAEAATSRDEHLEQDEHAELGIQSPMPTNPTSSEHSSHGGRSILPVPAIS